MDGLTLTRSLRATEPCDLTGHRSMRLHGEARICDKRALGQSAPGVPVSQRAVSVCHRDS